MTGGRGTAGRPTVRVARLADGATGAFDVAIEAGGATTRHRVTLGEADWSRWREAAGTPERLVEAAFVFLLEREPADAILSRFDFAVIARYFSEFDTAFPATLAGTQAQNRGSTPPPLHG